MGALEKKNRIHAAGRLNGADAATLVAGTGNWAATRGGAGDYTVTWTNDLIDTLEGLAFVTSRVISTFASVIAQTDTTIQIAVENDASAATDATCDFMVLRVAG